MPLYWVSRALLLIVVLVVPVRVFAQGDFVTKAPLAIAVHYQTNKILYEKDADTGMAPSSMTKLMTLYILFDKLKKGELMLDDTFPVSEKAWKKGGSKMFVEVGKRVKIEDLIRGIIVQSGNDACIVVAEGIAGSEEVFADEMNRYGEEIGLTGSYFVNSTGWPDEEHYMTSKDLARLTVKIISNFKEYYHYFAELEFTYSGIKQYNRNTLISKRSQEIDGLKTGHTESGGYGIVISGKKNQNSRERVIVVVNGLSSEKEREAESYRLFQHAMHDFETIIFYLDGEEIDRAKVWFGEEDDVPIVVGSNIIHTLSRFDRNTLEVSIAYNEPIQAPVKLGDHIADLRIKKADEIDKVIPLYAGRDVEKLSAFSRAFSTIDYYLFGE